MVLEALEIQGEWWLPGLDDRKIAGTLTFDPRSGAKLSLNRPLRNLLDQGQRHRKDEAIVISPSMESLTRAGTYPRLHGTDQTTAYTLDDCFRTEGSIFGGPEAVHVNVVYKGAWFEADEEPSAHSVSFDLRYLAHWINSTGIHEQWSWQEGDGSGGRKHRFSLTAEGLQDERTTLADQTEIVVQHGVGITGDGVTQRALTQHFSFQVKTPATRVVQELIDLASDLQDLVSIATGRTAQFEGMYFRHPDVFQTYGGERQREEPIEYLVPWNARDTSERPNRFSQTSMFFSYPQFGSMKGVGRWMATAKAHRGALGRVMASRYAPTMFVSDRLLNRAAALEAFDRQRTGYTTSRFRTRLHRCAKLAGGPFVSLIGDVSAWADVVRDDRDDVAHLFGRRISRASTEQYFVAESLYWLFILCMLRECSAPRAVFDHIQHHQHFHWLAPRIKAAIEGRTI